MPTRQRFIEGFEALRCEENRRAAMLSVVALIVVAAHVPLLNWACNHGEEWPWVAFFIEFFAGVALTLWLAERYFRSRPRRFGLFCAHCNRDLRGIYAWQYAIETGRCPHCADAVFDVSTEQTTTSTLGNKLVREPRQLHCPEHGERTPTFVCRHLVRGSRMGFHEPSGRSVSDHESREPCAWCDVCEQVRQSCGGWNDESEACVGITMICDVCFEAARNRNTDVGLTPADL